MKPKRKHPLPEGVTKETWLDKQDVMMRMYISSRTLQEWRKNGRLPYSRIGKKFYYPQSGLDRLLLDGMQ